MTWLALVSALRKAPTAVWWLLIGALVVGSAAWSVHDYGENRYQQGRYDALSGARFDSVVTAPLKARVDSLSKSTDSAVVVVKKAAKKVRDVIADVPPEVAALPSVAPVITSCTALEQATDSLTRALDIEKEARRMERVVMESQLKSAHAVIAVVRDSNAVLSKRPTRKDQIMTGIGGAVIGALALVVAR